MAAVHAPEQLGCAHRHADWFAVVQHLVDDFPEVRLADIIREVCRGKDAVERAGLDASGELSIGEGIARRRLLLVVGRALAARCADREMHIPPPRPSAVTVTG